MSCLPFAAGVRVSSIQVRGLTEAIADAGGSVETFLARSGLDSARLGDSAAWFALDEFDAFVSLAVTLSGEPAFGLRWGQNSAMTQFDLGPALVATAPSLRDAIDSLLRFQPVVINRPELSFGESGSRAVIGWRVTECSELTMRVRSELALTGFVRLLRYWGVSDALRRVNCAYPRPAYGAEYERLFGTCVHFEQAQSRVEFARSALARRSPHFESAQYQTVRERAEQLRTRALGTLTYASRVEQQVRAALPRMLSFADVADALELSERSLRRRLMHEQTCYRDVVDRVLRERAESLISLGGMSVKEVAHALGFDSVSGFHRAFQRWTGGSPARSQRPRPS